MKTFIKSIALFFISLFTTQLSTAQSQNLKTVDVKVYGNCGMCKKKIEKAGNIKDVAKTVWDAETAMATITIDTTKTSIDKVLQKIAAVGYDSDKFKAPDSVYNNLHGCCQYDRPSKNAKP